MHGPLEKTQCRGSSYFEKKNKKRPRMNFQIWFFLKHQHGIHYSATELQSFTLFVWLISHQPAVFFSQNKPATSNQSAVLFSQNKSAAATSQTNRLLVSNP
jgi:hypothetical protein